LAVAVRLPSITAVSLYWLEQVHRGKVPMLYLIPPRNRRALTRPGEQLIERRHDGNGKPRATLLGRYAIAAARAARQPMVKSDHPDV